MEKNKPNSMEHLQQPSPQSAFSYLPLAQPTLLQPMPPQAKEEIFREMMKEELAVQKECRKNELKLDLEKKKLLLRENARELRKAQYDGVVIKENGELEIQTQNTIINAPKRKIVNFRFVAIFQLKSSDRDEGIYSLHLNIADKAVQIFLNSQKAGNTAYLLRKLTAAGGVIFTDKKRIRESFLNGFWSLVLSRCEETIVIPAHAGWIKNRQGKFEFIEKEALLWTEILQCAK